MLGPRLSGWLLLVGVHEDLWRQLDDLAARHEVQWVWVRGHAGNDGNEQADALANRGVASVLVGAKGAEEKT